MINKMVILLGGLFLTIALHSQIVMKNNGKMYVGEGKISSGLYIKGSFNASDSCDIVHPGRTILTGDFINNTDQAGSYVFDLTKRSGVFEFRGVTSQVIGGTANKATHYIAFPNTVIINNSDASDPSVTIEPTMAANMKSVSFFSGRLVLDSKITSDENESDIAYLWLEDDAATIANNDIMANIQVNLDLGSREGHLIGFTPPFETMYADYFFFNFLSIPSETELFKGNSNELWSTNPKRALTAGTGYILGQVLVPYSNSTYYTSHLDNQWKTADFNQMIRSKFAFNRYVIPSTFGFFVANDASITNHYTGERLINKDVNIELNNGYNYLGNPFMVPLDLSGFVTGNDYADWGIKGTSVKNNYYLLSKGSTGKSEDSGATFLFGATYLVGQSIGSTVDPIEGLNEGGHLIAPMQMFVLKNEGEKVTTFKIPKSKRTHGNAPFLRSIANNIPVDELLIETKNTETESFDRLCVVFRNNAATDATDQYDVEKLFNRSGGVNQIYTRSTDGKILTTNMIPVGTKQLTMYLEPEIEEGDVELKAYRLSSLQSIAQVVLEDTKTGKKVDLTMSPTYAFHTSPADNPARFILHFNQTITSLEDVDETVPLTAYYKDGTIYIHGFEDNDIGKQLLIYDMVGQLLHKETIVNINPCIIYKSLPSGIYMIKEDKRVSALKLLVK